MSKGGRFCRAEIVDIDISVLHRTGRRVRNRGNMTSIMADMQSKAIDCLSDVEDLFDFYKLDEIEDLIELKEYLSKIENVKRDFRRVHAHLKSTEGEGAFKTKYPYYEKYIADLNTTIKSASKKVTDLRNKKDHKPGSSDTVQVDRERAKMKSDQRFFFQQAEYELQEFDWEHLDDISDIKTSISKFENRLESFFKICSDFDFHFNEGEMGEFKEDNDKLVESLKDKIRLGKTRLISVKNNFEKIEQEKLKEQEIQRQEAETARIEMEKIAEDKRVKDLLNCANNLHFEIKTRYTSFSSKCDVAIDDLNDFEVLNLKSVKRTFMLNSGNY